MIDIFKNWLLVESLGNSFMMSILENPTDETTYLIYADWLDDNGATNTAQFIRSVFERKKKVKGKLTQQNVIIKQSLPEIRRLVQPYMWSRVDKSSYYISMQGNNQDPNREYLFLFNNYPNYRFSRSTWGQQWVTTEVPGKVLIGEPRQGSVAGGDVQGMEALRLEAAAWEVPYVGNIIRNPPENLLHAMVLGNLYNDIPRHLLRTTKRSRRED